MRLAPIGYFEEWNSYLWVVSANSTASHIKDRNTSLVDNVETLDVIENMHVLLDDDMILSSAVRLEDFHRSTVSTLPHWQNRSR